MLYMTDYNKGLMSLLPKVTLRQFVFCFDG